MEVKQYPQIDILKGFMILFVIIIHSVFCDELFRQNLPIYEFLFYCAVPVLLIIMGINGYLSIERKNTIFLKEIYTKEYFLRRFNRILIPFFIIFIISLILGLLLDPEEVYIGIYTIYLHLPFGQAGNYYLSITFQFIFVFPLMYCAYKRKPKLTVLICFLISLIYSFFCRFRFNYVFSSNVGEFIPISFMIFWCLFMISLGMFIADKYEPNKLKDFLIKYKFIVVLFPFSCFFLFWLLYNPENLITICFGNWYHPRWLFAFTYYLMIVLIGLCFLPSIPKNKIIKFIAYVGKASYHIFLIQMIWFKCVSKYLIHFPEQFETYDVLIIYMLTFIHLVFCTILGILFYEFDKKYIRGKLTSKKLKKEQYVKIS